MKKDYRVINLNAWMGTKFDELMDFVKREKSGTDIFCFQEVTYTTTDRKETRGVRANLLEDIKEVLTDFDYYFEFATEGYDLEGKVDFPFGYGEATFWRKGIELAGKKTLFVHRSNSTDIILHDEWREAPNIVLITDFKISNQLLRIGNFHGIWEPGPKVDSKLRLEQSRRLLQIFEAKIPTILVGDFNLGIDNQSLLMLEEGRRSLIRESGVQSTRSSLYLHEGKFADYAIVTNGIEIKEFNVLGDEVSDHLPLEIIFSV